MDERDRDYLEAIVENARVVAESRWVDTPE